MKKNKFFFLLFFVFIALSSTPLHAEDLKDQKDRKGFFLGFGPYIGGEVNRIKQVAGGAELRIGGGLTDKTLLYAENNFIYTNKYALNYYAYDLQAKIQHFFYEGLYANLGVGFSVASASFSTIFLDTKVGLGLSGGLGYEFRVGKKFAISPEVAVYYRRLGGENYVVPAGIMNMSWYF